LPCLQFEGDKKQIVYSNLKLVDSNLLCSNMSNYIYCTLVFDNPEYVLGAITLAHSIRLTKSKYPIWCMYAGLNASSIKLLEMHFDNIVEVPILEQNVPDMPSKKQQAIYGSWIKKSFTKWNCMNPEIYGTSIDKVLFIDADMIFKQNPDELFELTTPACVFDFPYSRDVTSRGPINYFNTLVNNKRVSYDHGHKVNKKQLQLCLERGWHGILGAMILITPSAELFETMRDEFIHYEERTKIAKPICGADEQVLGRIIYRMFDDHNPVHIHKKYCFHVGKTAWYDGIPIGQHYCSAHPWNMERDSYTDVLEWYELFDDLCKTDPLAVRLYKFIKDKKRS
jgi:hypothetical protein